MPHLLLATVLAMSGVQIRNPTECSTLPPDQQLTCTREIRAGRAYESQDFDDFRDPPPVPQAQVGSQPVAPVPAAGPSLEERRVVAAERTANATETIAMIQVIALCLTLLSSILLLVAVK